MKLPITSRRFLKYIVIGVTTFAFDLFLLYVFTNFLLWNYIIATGVSFTIAISINYIFSRHFVFHGTLKSVGAGYVGFMSIACIGVIMAMFGMFILVGEFHIYYLNSRIIIAGIVGVWNYFMNFYVNLKVDRQ